MTVETAEGAVCALTWTVTDVTNGTLAYQWQLDSDGGGLLISAALRVDYTISVWADADHTGTYRCKITNTNHDVITEYSNECSD